MLDHDSYAALSSQLSRMACRRLHSIPQPQRLDVAREIAADCISDAYLAALTPDDIGPLANGRLAWAIADYHRSRSPQYDSDTILAIVDPTSFDSGSICDPEELIQPVSHSARLTDLSLLLAYVNPHATQPELAEVLGVSDRTIRRDLQAMAGHYAQCLVAHKIVDALEQIRDYALD